MRKHFVGSVSKNSNRLYGAQLIRNGIITAELFVEYVSDRQEADSFVNDELLRQQILYREYKRNNNLARNLLYMLESKLWSPHQNATLKTMGEYTLEHIMPRKWENCWGICRSEEERNRAIKRIGNLALLSQKVNASVSNGSWASKREALGTYGGGFQTLCAIQALNRWDEAEIARRADQLYALAQKAWPMPQVDSQGGFAPHYAPASPSPAAESPNLFSAETTSTGIAKRPLSQPMDITGKTVQGVEINGEEFEAHSMRAAFRIIARKMLELYPDSVARIAHEGQPIARHQQGEIPKHYEPLEDSGFLLHVGPANAKNILGRMVRLAAACDATLPQRVFLILSGKGE